MQPDARCRAHVGDGIERIDCAGIDVTGRRHSAHRVISGRAIGYVRRNDTWRIANSLLDQLNEKGGLKPGAELAEVVIVEIPVE